MADKLDPIEDTTHEYRYRIHAFAGYDLDGEVTLESHGPHIKRDNGALQVFTASTAESISHEEPPYTPLFVPHVHNLIGDEGDHTVTDSVSTGIAPNFLTILAPYKTGTESGEHAPLGVTPIETSSGAAAWLIETDAHQDIAWIRENNAETELILPSGQSIQTDAAFVFLSLTDSQALLSRGTYLKINNETHLECDNSAGVCSTQ